MLVPGDLQNSVQTLVLKNLGPLFDATEVSPRRYLPTRVRYLPMLSSYAITLSSYAMCLCEPANISLRYLLPY